MKLECVRTVHICNNDPTSGHMHPADPIAHKKYISRNTVAASAAAGVSVAAAVISGIHQALADQNAHGRKTEVAAVVAVSKNWPIPHHRVLAASSSDSARPTPLS